MSVLLTDPGFGRGHTLGVKLPEQGTSVTGTVKAFTDTDPRTINAGVHLSNRPVTCVAARNTSGGPLLPGTVVKFKAEAILDEVDGPADAGDVLGVVDEYLPAVGCPDGDVCWVVTAGPCAIKTSGSFAGGDLVTAAAGEAAAGSTSDAIGVVIKEPVDGLVRVLVGTKYGHSA